MNDYLCIFSVQNAELKLIFNGTESAVDEAAYEIGIKLDVSFLYKTKIETLPTKD